MTTCPALAFACARMTDERLYAHQVEQPDAVTGALTRWLEATA